MTRQELHNRTVKLTWDRLTKRAAIAPHGKKREREKELRAFVRDRLVKEAA